MEALRKIWRRFFEYNWKFGIFLIVLFGIPRFILVFQANMSGGYGVAFIIFFIMWFAPLVFLTKQGRREIGIKRPNQYIRLLYSFGIGILSCAIIFGIFLLLFDKSLSNAFVYMGRVGSVPGSISDSDKFIYLIISAIPIMLFSPIGEEFLYRGVVHGSFVSRFGETKASVFDSLAFAFTHLANFGIIYNAGNWSFLPIPAFIWVLSMFLLSLVFFRCKLMCDSIFGAVFSHAGFNLAMMYIIFYHIL